MTKTLLTILIVWALSLAVTFLTVDGAIAIGDFALEVPNTVYSGSVWLSGIMATVIVPMGVKAWMANRYNIMYNAGLQDMKLNHILSMMVVLMEQNKGSLPSDFNLSEIELNELETLMQGMIDKGNNLLNTVSNYATATSEQKINYLNERISMTEAAKELAQRMGDNKLLTKLGKELKGLYKSKQQL